MKKPPLAANEGQRLAALRALNILDTPPEERFDRITRLARKLFNVPIAKITLIDAERQWFKSCQGLSVRETSRDISFCGHAILSEEGLVIPDTLLDERFADNPLVLGETGIRFYAGQPLRAPDGSQVGVLCIEDHRPHSWRSEDRELLGDLAHLVEDQLHLIEISELQREMQERTRAEEALRQANARLDLAVRGTNLAIWECDMPDGRIENSHPTLVNFWESLGYDSRTTPADFPSLVALTMHPDDQGRVGREIQEFLVSGRQAFETEVRARYKDGSDRWHLTRGVAVRDPTGKAVRFIGSSFDITALKRAEEALRERERQLDSLMGHLPGLAYRALADEHWTALFASKGVEDLTGYPGEEFTSRRRNYGDIMLPEDRPATREAVFTALAERRMYEAEHRIRHKDGSVRWIWARGHGVFAPDGSLRFIEGLNLDMTRQKQAEEALRESEERFRGTFENAAVGIVLNDASGRFLRVNEKYCAIVGYSREELLQKTLQDIIHPDELAAFLELYTSSFARDETPRFGYERHYLRKDGSTVWVEVFPSFQRDASGRPTYAIAAVQDISERKRLEGELLRAKESAESANRAKDEFLANVSHEIRTPMNAILGMAEIALDAPLSDEQRNHLNIIKVSAEGLLSVINDLLDFSKMEAGRLDLDETDFSLRMVLNETLRALALRAHKKGLELVCQVERDVPDGLVGDANRLRQILLNLVGNAIKFTEAGEVIVRVNVQEAEQSFAIGFEITDTGIGIPAELQQKIFQAFEQADSSTTRRYGGTGLGLTIASRLVEMMGGHIAVESEVGGGSTFRFAARFGRSTQLPATSALPPVVDLKELRVLVVDDNATNRMILEEWLRAWGMKPISVPDGLAAMSALWRGLAAHESFALLLLDARMPGTDGYELAKKISQTPEFNSCCRIIVLTSEDRPEDVSRYRALGITAILMKPIQQEELLDSIYRVLSQTTAPAAVVPRVSTPQVATNAAGGSTGRLNVLLAEDNEFNQLVMQRLLERRGHIVRSVRNGKEALEVLNKDHFDLLLLDVHMPEMDGFQVIKTIRAREQEKDDGEHKLVIALTALSRKEDRQRCLEAGMDDYLVKPVRRPELDAVIERVLTGRPATKITTAHIASPEIAQRAGSLIDKSMLLTACDSDEALLKEIIQIFQSEAPRQLSAIETAIRQGDSSQLREAAHKLKGLVSTFSNTAAADLEALEQMGADGRCSDATDRLLIAAQRIQDLITILPTLTLQQLQN